MTSSRFVTTGRVLALVLLSTTATAAQGARGTATPGPATTGGARGTTTPGAATTAQGARDAASASQPGPLEKQANPVTPENPIPRRSYSVAPVYPQEALGTGIFGTLTLKLTLDQSGHVGEARATDLSFSGAQASAVLQGAFRRSALDAVKQWIYDSPSSPPISLFVQVSFVPDAESGIVWHDAKPPTSRVITASGATSSFGAIPPPPPPNGAIRVGGNIAAPKKIKDVAPVYPPIAQSARVSGIVIIEATIGADGRVLDALIIRSIPLLDQAALDAVRQWEFTPTLLNGAPVPIIMSVTVNFTLQN